MDNYTKENIKYAIAKWAWQARAELDEQKAEPSDEQLEAIWLDVSSKPTRYKNNFPCDIIDFARALLSKYAAPAPSPCNRCDGTGDVHSIDGEWRGACVCDAGKAVSAPAPKGEPVACLWVKNGIVINAFPHPPGDQAIWDPDGYWAKRGFERKPLYAAPVNGQDAKDAERWRFVRKHWGYLAESYEAADPSVVSAVMIYSEGWDVDRDSLDAAIDAAIAQQGKGK